MIVSKHIKFIGVMIESYKNDINNKKLLIGEEITIVDRLGDKYITSDLNIIPVKIVRRVKRIWGRK